VEQPKPEQLVQLLEANGKDPCVIIEVLSDIIKQQLMYGGSIQDKLNFNIEKEKRSL